MDEKGGIHPSDGLIKETREEGGLSRGAVCREAPGWDFT